MDWINISNTVLERSDLNIYEKMCYVYIAASFQKADEELSIDDLAKRMGVEPIVAKGAFYALKAKGILVSVEPEFKPGSIIKASDVDVKLTSDEKLNRVFEIIEEKISVKEAKIILSFAGGNLERIEEKYKIALASQYNDKIEVLIHELQKKPESRIIKKDIFAEKDHVAEAKPSPLESFDDTEKEQIGHILEDFEPAQKTQVNTYKLNQMRKYKKK